MKPNNLLFYCLLANGHLPEYMPPPFTSKPFAAYADSMWPQFQGLQIQDKDLRATEPANYMHPRPNGARRRFRICNPSSYAMLAGTIADNISFFSTFYPGTIALTTPTVAPSIPSDEVRQYPNDRAREERHIRARGSNRYLVNLDISQFFGSIYTHGIEWLLAGKPVAKSFQKKANKNKAKPASLVIGSQIDLLARQCNSNQTMGLPIGPHTSHIIAESILSDVDAKANLSPATAIRVTDDYDIYCNSWSEVQEVIACLQWALDHFELSLNDNKTKVEELPRPLRENWVYELMSCDLSGPPHRQRKQLVRLFDLAFHYHESRSSPSSISFAIGMINYRAIYYENIFLLVDLIRHCITIDPSSMHKGTRLLTDIKIASADKKDEIQQTIFGLLDRGTRARHGSELAWALWMAVVLDIPIDSDLARKVLKVEDVASTMVCCHLTELGLIDQSVTKSNMTLDTSDDAIYGPNWLFAYEARTKKWIGKYTGAYGKPFQDSVFEKMRKAGVYFYEFQDPIKSTKLHRMSLPRWRRPIANYF